MFKKILPFVLTILSVILDTSVIPVFYYGRFLVPLSLVTVMLLSMRLGFLHGMLHGAIAGLLLDITVGTYGVGIFPYIIVGFFVGILLSHRVIDRSMNRRQQLAEYLRRFIVFFVFALLSQIGILVVSYFNNAVLYGGYVLTALIRALLISVIALALSFPAYALLRGSREHAFRSFRKEAKL